MKKKELKSLKSSVVMTDYLTGEKEIDAERKRVIGNTIAEKRSE